MWTLGNKYTAMWEAGEFRSSIGRYREGAHKSPAAPSDRWMMLLKCAKSVLNKTDTFSSTPHDDHSPLRQWSLLSLQGQYTHQILGVSSAGRNWRIDDKHRKQIRKWLNMSAEECRCKIIDYRSVGKTCSQTDITYVWHHRLVRRMEKPVNWKSWENRCGYVVVASKSRIASGRQLESPISEFGIVPLSLSVVSSFHSRLAPIWFPKYPQ